MKVANNIKREYKRIHDYWHFPVFELNFKRWKLSDGFAAQKVSRNSILNLIYLYFYGSHKYQGRQHIIQKLNIFILFIWFLLNLWGVIVVNKII